MGNGLLSRVNWGETLVFMLLRIAFGTVGIFILFILTGGLQGWTGGTLLALPLFVVFMSGISLLAAWLSQLGLPFAGLISMVCSIPMYIGDPMVWVLHKIRPRWVPVAEPDFINAPLVWVLKE